MRLASLILLLTCLGTVDAQDRLWGGAPRQLNFTPIDTSRAVMPSNASRAIRMPGNALTPNTNATRWFPMISLGTWPPKTPNVSVMPQAQNPYQPTAPSGGFSMANFLPGFLKK